MISISKTNFYMLLLIEMEVATPRGIARALDPGLSTAREAAKAVPPGKRPPQ